ncbi:MAG TPA: metallophosphoesterase [Pyrinomonadaceae bacterium]|nr:metallophosphoesterase [Pyrinomonadaceae bacterium]
MKRTIVIGDIHGCFDELVSLLEKAEFGPEDQLVAVGDLIVKGPANKEVLELFSKDPRFSSVIGNHDLAILNFWRGKTAYLKDSQHKARLELEPEKDQHEKYLASLPYIIDLGTHAVVHAGVRPGVPFKDQLPADLTELRTMGADRTSREGTPWFEVYEGEKILLFGHWPSAKPRRGPRAIGLDTGCVYGNCLSAYILETDEVIQVPAKRVYDRPRARFHRQIQ